MCPFCLQFQFLQGSPAFNKETSIDKLIVELKVWRRKEEEGGTSEWRGGFVLLLSLTMDWSFSSIHYSSCKQQSSFLTWIFMTLNVFIFQVLGTKLQMQNLSKIIFHYNYYTMYTAVRGKNNLLQKYFYILNYFTIYFWII